jgi:hypothetical protein
MGVGSSAGDVNGDGFGDVALDGGSAILFFHGSSTGLSEVPDGTLAEPLPSTAGHAIAGGVYLDSDSWPDVVIAFHTSSSSVIRVLDAHELSRTIATIMAPDAEDMSFASEIAAGGDVDGDGLQDLIVGSYAYQNYSGRAYVFFNSPSANFNTYTILPAPGGMGRFGYSIASGDVAGDGIDDMVIGAPVAYLVNGRADHAFTSVLAQEIRPSGSDTTRFGGAVGVADVLGDGNARIFLGGFFGDTGSLQEFSAFSPSAPVAFAAESMPACFGSRFIAR